MIKTYARIVDGKVDAIQKTPEEHISDFTGTWIELQEGFGHGDSYDGSNFSNHVISDDEARLWRDQELESTDFIVPTTDYPNHAAWITYRQELRDWTGTADFPNTKPIKP